MYDVRYTYSCSIHLPDCMQEEQLRSSEALVADFQRTIQQKDSELETLRTLVRPLINVCSVHVCRNISDCRML